MKHLYLLLFIIFMSGHLCAQQTTTLSGIVKSSGSEKVEGYTVVLLNAADSLSITWKYSKTDAFQFTYDANKYKNTILYLSSFGYKDVYVNVKPETTNLGTITLEPQVNMIDEVVVKGYSSVSHNFVRGKDEFSIPMSISARETSLYSLLRQIPGLDVSGTNEVKIIGTGAPVFTINGLTPRPGELAALEPDRIDKVIINRMPSAKFNKNVVGVIDIITKKSLRDFLSVRIADIFNQTDLASNNASVQINSKVGRWSNFISYSNEFSQNKIITDYRTSIYSSTPSQQNTLGEQRFKNLSHNIIFSPKIELSKKSFIDAQYRYSESDTKTRSNHILDFVEKEIDNSVNSINTTTGSHGVILRYRNQLSNNSGITLNAGYSNYSTKGNSKIKEEINIPDSESPSGSIETIINNKYRSQTATASIDYDFVLFKKLDVNIGGRYAMLMNDSYSFYPITSMDYTNERKETQASLYLSISQGWKKFSYQLGLREEYRYVHHAANKDENKNPYDFMPSLGFSYMVNDKINMTLYLQRSSDYPTVSQLNPNLSYVNKFQYYTGNPNLKPGAQNSIRYRIALPKNISVDMSYTNSDNQIIQMYLIDNIDETKTYSTYVNLGVVNYISSTLSWWKRFKYNMTSVQFSYTHCLSSQSAINTPGHSNKPDLYIKINNSFFISKNIYSTVAFWYNSPYNITANIYTGKEYGLDIGVNFSLLKKKLRIQVQGNNLIYRHSNLQKKYDRIYTNNTNIMQSRNFQVTLTYSFNNFRDLFKKNDANADIINRAN